MSNKDSLAQLNDHFARFLQHADSLLDEWKSYGDQLRSSIDSEVHGLQSKMATAVENAGKTAAANLDGQVETSLGEGLARLRGEVDQLTKLTSNAAASVRAGGGSATSGAPSRSPLVLGALLVANAMLAVLLVMSARSCSSSDGAGGAAVVEVPDAAAEVAVAPPPDAAPPIDAVPPPPEYCAALTDDYELAAAKLFVESAASVCGEAADAVKENLTYNLPAKPKKKPKEKPKKKGAR